MEVKEKTSEVKEKILKEAQSLFWKYGVKSVTMDDIARHLAMSKKTLYQFFNDKDDLICQIVDEFLKFQEAEVDGIRKSSTDALHEIFQISQFIKSTFENMTTSLLFELKKYHPKAYNIFVEHKHTCLLESIVSNLNDGIKNGLYRADINVDVISKLRLGQVEMAFDPDIFPAKKYKLEEVQSQIFDLFIYGITTLKGHKLLNKYKQINEEEQ